MTDAPDVAGDAARLADAAPLEVLRWAVARFGRVGFATGFGPEGCVLIDLIGTHRLPIEVITLDTGLLFAETVALWRELEARYGIAIRAVRPARSVAEQAADHGEALWLRDPDACCGLRKVAPLAAAAAGLEAWVSAIRRDQTGDRADAQVLEVDRRFGLPKINPLVAWSSDDVWRYLRARGVPTNPLHARGYPSIGCAPCTTPVATGEDPRAGRWRGRAKDECGLHRRPDASASSSAVASIVAASRLVRTIAIDASAPVGARTHSLHTGARRMTVVQPHGGSLVDRVVGAEAADALRREAVGLPAIRLDARELADLELIATGAASPITGFLGRDDHARVVAELRLASGVVWPLPLTLAVDDATRARLVIGGRAALEDERGRLWGVIAIEDLYERDPLAEARAVYGTDDAQHPGVAYLLARPTHLVGGAVEVLPLPDDLPFARYRLTPTQLRAAIAARGWSRVAGFQTRNPIHRAHEHLTKIAIDVSDGLVIHPLVGETKQDDVPAAVRFAAYEALVERYYPAERVILAAFPAAMRYAGPREALFHALVRKNYGIDRLIVGRDHAGVGSYYPPLAAQQIFDGFSAEELGVTPLRLQPTFYCRSCVGLASAATCPHPPAARLELSGSRVRQILAEGGDLPVELTRPEVAEVLRAHYRAVAGVTAAGAVAAVAPSVSAAATTVATPPAARARRGFILWFTGLSGAGKSTLAEAVRARLAGARPIEILDGDEVRTHLSKGLGFSRTDRDTNIHRIGFVARTLARNGVAVATAAISPYASTRAEVRALAEAQGITFVEVFAQAELDALVARDVKGLYRKALAGEIRNFTGVDDPYEAPEAADVVVRTDRESVADSAAAIVATLRARGLIDDAVDVAALPPPRTPDTAREARA